MAAQITKEETIKWKDGTLCELFDRKQRKWTDGEVIGSFSNENGDFVKIRCGPEIHDVLRDDPDLRVRAKNMTLISNDKLKELQEAVTDPDVVRALQWIMESPTEQSTSYDR